jgi:hypothetical protein
MPAGQTLHGIGGGLLTELLRSRTDFLLQQATLWQEMNDKANLVAAFAKPENLDLYHTRFEFCMKQHIPWYDRVMNLLRKRPKGVNRYRICSGDEMKKIRVTISIRIDKDQQVVPDITTDPRIEQTPRETYVTGIAF